MSLPERTKDSALDISCREPLTTPHHANRHHQTIKPITSFRYVASRLCWLDEMSRFGPAGRQLSIYRVGILLAYLDRSTGASCKSSHDSPSCQTIGRLCGLSIRCFVTLSSSRDVKIEAPEKEMRPPALNMSCPGEFGRETSLEQLRIMQTFTWLLSIYIPPK